MDREAWWATVRGVAELDTAEQLTHTRYNFHFIMNLSVPNTFVKQELVEK